MASGARRQSANDSINGPQSNRAPWSAERHACGQVVKLAHQAALTSVLPLSGWTSAVPRAERDNALRNAASTSINIIHSLRWPAGTAAATFLAPERRLATCVINLSKSIGSTARELDARVAGRARRPAVSGQRSAESTRTARPAGLPTGSHFQLLAASSSRRAFGPAGRPAKDSRRDDALTAQEEARVAGAGHGRQSGSRPSVSSLVAATNSRRWLAGRRQKRGTSGQGALFVRFGPASGGEKVAALKLETSSQLEKRRHQQEAAVAAAATAAARAITFMPRRD